MRRLQLVCARFINRPYCDLDAAGIQHAVKSRELIPLKNDGALESSRIYFLHYFRNGEVENFQPKYNLIEECGTGEHRIILYGAAGALHVRGSRVTFTGFSDKFGDVVFESEQPRTDAALVAAECDEP